MLQPCFECDRFSCGESNFWANHIFKIARLYGLDKAQSYFVGSQIEAGKTVYYLVYTVRRGNKREYALVDVFTLGQKAGQPDTLDYPVKVAADHRFVQKNNCVYRYYYQSKKQGGPDHDPFSQCQG